MWCTLVHIVVNNKICMSVKCTFQHAITEIVSLLMLSKSKAACYCIVPVNRFDLTERFYCSVKKGGDGKHVLRAISTVSAFKFPLTRCRYGVKQGLRCSSRTLCVREC